MSSIFLIFSLIPVKIQRRIVFFMDIPTLRSLRYATSDTAKLVEEELTRSLHSLLSPFVTHPANFLQVLQQSGAVIGGDIAVAFMARDLPIIPRALIIYAPLDNPYPLQDYFQTQENTEWMRRVTPSLENAAVWRGKLVKEFVHFQHRTSIILLYESSSPLPLASVVSRALASHNMTFVDGVTYGTAFPSLFFQRRCLLGPPLFSQALDVSTED